MKKQLFLAALAPLFLALTLSSCNKEDNDDMTTSVATLENIDTSSSTDGIVALPQESGVFATYFEKYTKLDAPNGKSIHIIAQNNVSDEQIKKAKMVLSFYLADAPSTILGGDKSAIFNAMADNNATLAIFNTESSAEQAIPELEKTDYNFQDLYATECFVEGTSEYMNNFAGRRDATYEEVLHLVQDYGIKNGNPDFYTDIETAAIAAKNEGFWNSSQMAEWEAEGSLGQEYFATIVEVYYGMWAHANDAFFGEYSYTNRAELMANDPAGYNLVVKFLPPTITTNSVLTESYFGAFSMAYDAGEAYTNKTQYLTDLTLQGTNNVTVQGNQYNNYIIGNAGQNTVIFRGNFTDYNFSNEGNGVYRIEDTLDGRDGIDIVKDVERIQFANQTIDL